MKDKINVLVCDGSLNIKSEIESRITKVPNINYLGFCSNQLIVESDGSVYPCDFYVLDEYCLGNIKDKKVLELCAAPGGKTAQLLTEGAKVTCLDVSDNRLKILKENMNRLNLVPEKIVCADGIEFLENAKEEKFEIVVLDAPCSATGTLRRHPEVVHIKGKKDVLTQAKVQKDFLSKVDKVLCSGGVLLYCTCSLCKEEGEFQIKEFLNKNKNYKIINLKDKIEKKLKMLVTEDGFLRVLPHYMDEHGGADGFFAAFLRKE